MSGDFTLEKNGTVEGIFSNPVVSTYTFPNSVTIRDGDICKFKYTYNPDTGVISCGELKVWTPLLVRLKRILHTLTGHCFE